MAPDAATPEAPSSLRGRNAWVLHGMALAFAGMTAVAGRLMNWDEKDVYPVLAVGGAATVILGGWSLVLALRAIRRRECLAPPLYLLLLMLLEASLAVQLLWICNYTAWPVLQFNKTARDICDLVFQLWLPVLLPASFVCIALAAPFARWRVRRAEGVSVAAGAESWSPRQRWRHGLKWGVRVFVVTLTLILPAPLFLYCATSNNFGTDYFRQEVARAMPDFIRNGVDTALGWPGLSFTEDLRHGLIQSECLTTQRLIEHVHGADMSHSENALRILIASKDPRALAICLEIGRGNVPASRAMIEWSSNLIAAKGSLDDLKALLTSPTAPGFMCETIMIHCSVRGRKDTLPILVEVAKGMATIRSEAFSALLGLGTVGLLTPIWIDFIRDSNPTLRNDAIDWLFLNDQIGLLDACMFQGDLLVRRRILVRRSGFIMMPLTTPQFMAGLLDDPDLAIRRGAFMYLKRIRWPSRRQWFSRNNTPLPNAAADPNKPVEDGGDPAPETSAELKELEDLRAAVKKYLEALRQK